MNGGNLSVLLFQEVFSDVEVRFVTLATIDYSFIQKF